MVVRGGEDKIKAKEPCLHDQKQIHERREEKIVEPAPLRTPPEPTEHPLIRRGLHPARRKISGLYVPVVNYVRLYRN